MHPILVEIPTPWGAVPIYSYGVMLGVSMILAWFVVMWIGEREWIGPSKAFDRELLANTFIVTAISALIGARLLYVITNPHEFDTIGDFLALRRGGLVAYGGFLAGFFGALGYLRYRNASLLSFADVAAPTLALGLALTRIGCYLYGCDYGARLGEGAPAWLVSLGTFPQWPDGNGSPAWSHHVAEYGLASDAGHSYPVHPTQIYESLAGFALLGATLVIWRLRTFRGQVLLALAALYGIWRFAIEEVRDDPERGFVAGFSTSQLISLAIVPVAALFYWQARKQQQEKPFKVMRLGAPETYAPLATPAARKPSKLAEPASEDRESAPSPDSETASIAKRSGAAPKKTKKKKKR